jgi:hypothetical protein
MPNDWADAGRRSFAAAAAVAVRSAAAGVRRAACSPRFASARPTADVSAFSREATVLISP